MRIGIDAKFLAYRRGHGNYSFSLLSNVGRLNSSHEFLVYATGNVERGTLASLANGRLRVLPVGPGNYILREQMSLPFRAARDRVDLLHCPDHGCPFILPRKTKLVVTLHDVIFMMQGSELPHPTSLYQCVGRAYRRLAARHMARRADAILTDSQTSARDIRRYLGVPASRIVVAHLAAGEAFRRLNPTEVNATISGLGISSPFIFALGAVDPRKNTARVISAFARFRARSSAFAHQLVIAGLSGRALTAFRRLAQITGVEEHVKFFGFISEPTLVALYNRAEALVYPSLYEGFGLPVLEAMACGTAAIGSTTGSIPEVAGEAAVLVNPYDVDAIAAAMTQVALDRALRDSLIERGIQRAAEFSWERCARQTLAVYERCLAA
ncbi:MAG: glycosyltransferase family 4 protein [Candidatus Binataceae bacterium]